MKSCGCVSGESSNYANRKIRHTDAILRRVSDYKMRAVVVALHVAAERGGVGGASGLDATLTQFSLRVHSIDAASFSQRLRRGPVNHWRSKRAERR